LKLAAWFTPGLPDLSWYKIPKRGEIHQMTTKYTKWPYVKYFQWLKIDQKVIKYTNIFHHCKTLQKLPKLGFLVRKQTIWQPWFTQTKKDG
jgi:hypothetical protein